MNYFEFEESRSHKKLRTVKCWFALQPFACQATGNSVLVIMIYCGASRKYVKRDLGVQGLWGAIFILDIMKRIAGKPCRLNLLHFEKITFKIHDRTTLKPSIYMVLGPGRRHHDSQHQYYLSPETPGHSKQCKKRISTHIQRKCVWKMAKWQL